MRREPRGARRRLRPVADGGAPRQGGADRTCRGRSARGYYDLGPYFRRQAKEAPRREFLYWNGDGKLVALRYNRWKLVFSEQRSHGMQPFVDLRPPALYDLRSDPFERASHESIGYPTWRIDRVYRLVPAQTYVVYWLATFKEFPPRQKPASFSLDQVMQKIQETAGASN